VTFNVIAQLLLAATVPPARLIEVEPEVAPVNVPPQVLFNPTVLAT
jgi:hypothetical protein